MPLLITKYSGEKEPFSGVKFKRSLERSGANEELVSTLLENIRLHPELQTTRDIYHWALNRLKNEKSGLAARYNLKQALFDLGPTGFPFEKYIAHLMQAQGYTTQTDQILTGTCVTHEIDLLFYNSTTFNFAECKFHNNPSLITAVQVPLYVKARADDVVSRLAHDAVHGKKKHLAWVITNTRFTSQALQYSNCAGLKILSWAHPEQAGLRELIDKHNVHPITTLTTLTIEQKKQLINNNVLLCNQINEHTNHLQNIGISEEQRAKIIAEARGVGKL